MEKKMDQTKIKTNIIRVYLLLNSRLQVIFCKVKCIFSKQNYYILYLRLRLSFRTMCIPVKYTKKGVKVCKSST